MLLWKRHIYYPSRGPTRSSGKSDKCGKCVKSHAAVEGLPKVPQMPISTSSASLAQHPPLRKLRVQADRQGRELGTPTNMIWGTHMGSTILGTCTSRIAYRITPELETPVSQKSMGPTVPPLPWHKVAY